MDTILAVVLLAVSVSAHAGSATRQLLLDSAMVNAVDRRTDTWWTPPEVPTEAAFFLREPTKVESVKIVWHGVAAADVRYRLETFTDGAWKAWNGADARVTDALKLVLLGAPKGVLPSVAEFAAYGVPPPVPGSVSGLYPDLVFTADGAALAGEAEATTEAARKFYRERHAAVIESRARLDRFTARKHVAEMRTIAVAAKAADNKLRLADLDRVIARLDAITEMFSGIDTRGYPVSEDERYAPECRVERNAKGEVVVEGKVVSDEESLVCANGKLARLVVIEPSETAQWQAAIDRASAAGGGTVTVPKGRHKIGAIFLKDNVTLELAEGAVLVGLPGIQHYVPVDVGYAEVREPWYGLVCAVGAKNIAIVGKGEIFGDGTKFPQGERVQRPRGLLFYNCRGVKLEDVTLKDLASWTAYFRGCDGVTLRRVTVDSHANRNNDGLDIDSKNVLIEDCVIDSDDDGVVLKSDNPRVPVENVTVRNCRVSSNCSGLKLGTGSHGGFINVHFENITCGVCTRGTGDLKKDPEQIGLKWRLSTWPGSTAEKTLISGIAVECVDGARVENISFKNVSIEKALTPIFIRGGTRYGRSHGAHDVGLGIPMGDAKILRNVLIENVTATATSFTANSITGTREIRPTDITLRNVTISVPGAGEAGKPEIARSVPEVETAYPESNMFDGQMLPAYGFYIRHADNVKFENVKVTVRGTEFRKEIVTDDVTSKATVP